MKKILLQLSFVLLAFCSVQAQELCVGSYNLRYKNSKDTDAGNGWNTRRTYLINLVNFQQPDLLGVQEAYKAQMDDMLSGMTGYAYTGVGRDNGTTGGEYSAIFYRKDRLLLLDNGDFWLSDTPYTPSKGFPSVGGGTSYKRICSWGKFFDKATGTVIYHFNTHLDLDEINRQQSYYLIKQKIEEIASKTAPVIISGDYNAVQTGDAYKLFYNSGFLYDCYARAKQKFITNGTCPGFNANSYSTVSGELKRIDHIFITRAFNVDHYAVLNPCYYSESGSADYHLRAYSDHSPVFVKLSIRNPEMAEIPTTPPPSVNGVYQLSTPEHLLVFSYIVNGKAGFSQNTSAKAVLLNDIDMANVNGWLPIGTESKPYTGTFDGQGYSIQNLTVKTGKSYSGLFGKTSGATIKNFRLSGSLTVAEWTSEHGVVGYANASTIIGVHSSLNITTSKANTDTKHIGGIAGTIASNTYIHRCSYSGTLSDAGTNTVGGIVGYADQSGNIINYALNSGKVQSKGSETNTGGILGYVNYADFKISYCLNVGTVSGKEPYAGQIIGRQVKAMSTLPSNLYYLDGQTLKAFGSDTDPASAVGATAVNAEQLASGEVCYQLNDPLVDMWFQNLPGPDSSVVADPYPVLFDDHLRVWYYDGVYSNYSPEEMDGINSLAPSLPEGKGVVYDLYGRKIDSSLFTLRSSIKKGVYIINGKKILK